MKRSIFISRNLPTNSLLLQFLTKNDWDVHHQSLIEIEPVDFEIKGAPDWIFISSSNGARILLESYQPSATMKLAAVGEATASAIKQFDLDVHFVGESGDMIKVGQDFKQVLGDSSVLFVGAEGGSEKVRNQLPANQVSFLPIYRTMLKVNVDLPLTDVVFLTSPSNAEAYLNVEPLLNKTVISIGNTTAEYLNFKGIENVLIPKSPREEDVIALLESL